MLSQRLRSLGILDATPYLHAGYRCCAACAFAHLSTSFPNLRRGKACAKDNNLYPVRSDDTIWKMLGQLCYNPGYSSTLHTLCYANTAPTASPLQHAQV